MKSAGIKKAILTSIRTDRRLYLPILRYNLEYFLTFYTSTYTYLSFTYLKYDLLYLPVISPCFCTTSDAYLSFTIGTNFYTYLDQFYIT